MPLSEKPPPTKADGPAIRAEKRRKFELKQRRRNDERRRDDERAAWFDRNGSYAIRLETDDARRAREVLSSREGGERSSRSDSGGERGGAVSLQKITREAAGGESTNNDDAAVDVGAAGEGGGDDRSRRITECLAPYLDLKEGNDRRDKGNGDGGRRFFIAEGTETVRLLVRQSAAAAASSVDDSRAGDGATSVANAEEENGGGSVHLVSILCKPAALFDEPVRLLADVERAALDYSELLSQRRRRRATGDDTCKKEDEGNDGDAKGSLRDPPFRVVVGSEDALSEVAGFRISRGALACGVVPRRDEGWLDRFLTERRRKGETQEKEISTRIVALDRVDDAANLGSVLRTAAAFGVHAVVLSDDSCDAWYRRSVRVSMGHVMTIPTVRVGNLETALRKMSTELGVATYAAVVDRDAEATLEDLHRGDVPKSWCCVIGNEGNGISSSVIKACQQRIRIGMVRGVDSLSVPVATGILLHGLHRLTNQT